MDPNKAAHYEPPHRDLHCLQVQLFSVWCIFILVPFKIVQTGYF